MYLFHEFRDRMRRWLGQGKLKNAKVRRVVLGGLFFALLTLIMAGQVAPQRLEVTEGEVAPRDVVATRDIINRVATDRKREAAAGAVPIVRTVDKAVLRRAEDFIIFAFNEVQTVRGLPNQDLKTKVDSLSSKLSLGKAVPPETYASLLAADDKLLEVAREDALSLVRQAYAGPVSKEAVPDILLKIDQEAQRFTLATTAPWLKAFVKELIKPQITSNLVDNMEETERLRKAAAQVEEPVVWKKGQIVIKKGEPVTHEQYAMLEDLRLVGPRADFRSYFGTALLALVLVGVMALYLVRYRPDVLERDSKLLLLGLIGVMTLLLAILMKSFQESLGTGAAYLMPIAVNSMLVTILLDPKVALLQSVILSLVAAMATEVNQIGHAMVTIAGSAVGVYAVHRIESRTDIYRAGLLVSATNMATILALALIQAESLLDPRPWMDAGLGAANGLIVAVLVTGALPLFENLFGVVTPLKLLELSNPNHPLLKKLLVEAPGSYHHTILVANLCEAAAEAIGADPVLSRVGAYYHDVGKAKRPYFFVENQFGGENPHDKLPPSLSALIITSHVKDGVEMAREARMPQEIIDFITEHHGTTLVSYFYHMASKTGQSEYVLEEDFRYDGPKPRTKETAILMLADGCEASVRAMRQKGHLTVDLIEAQVKRIISDRLSQGQLENCDITLRDLDVITKTFVKVLSGVHHARIEYPPEAIPAKLPEPAVPPADRPEEESQGADLDQQRSGEGGADGGPGGTGAQGGREGDEPGGPGTGR